MKTIDIELPQSFLFNRRRFFRRSQIEHLKRCLIARATNGAEPEYERPVAEQFVNATQVAKELGISRRTMARRIAEADAKRNIAGEVAA